MSHSGEQLHMLKVVVVAVVELLKDKEFCHSLEIHEKP
jgi:hypothetical protein